ncbi:M48 family metalloprotease [Aquincola sp. MAHUQ-54]|uniref:M48 family metalloprotease n=1 Tax=Aquincola agrisoli TaxID=3119538 RepID=A0AAW9PY29_9BURK
MRDDAVALSLAKMRQESKLRSALLVLVLCAVPTLLVGSAYPFELSDLLFPLGAPLGHVAHAFLIYLGLLAALIIGSEQFAARTVGRPGEAPPVGATVSRIVDELSRRMGISVETQAFGGGEIEAVQAYRRRIVRIGVARLRESIFAPQDFSFVVAHELTHLASNDARTDRIVRSAYLAGSLFLLAAFARVLWAIGEGIAVTWRFGFQAVISSLANSWIALFTNSVSLGTLTLLFMLERRSAMRLREFHADAVASTLVRSASGIMEKLRPTNSGRFARVIARVLGTHPEREHRRAALEGLAAAFQSDRILLLLQGYFAAMLLEILLQMLFVGASPSMSSLAERRTHLAQSISDHPVSVWCVISTAAAMVGLSQLIVLRRIALVAAEAAALRLGVRLWAGSATMVGAGTILSLLTSQTFYWEMSLSRWNLLAWAKADPDRLSLYGILWVGMVFPLALTLAGARQSPASRDRTILAATVPVGLALIVGFGFYG